MNSLHPSPTVVSPPPPWTRAAIALLLWAGGVVVASGIGALGWLGERFMPGYAFLVLIGIAAPVAAWRLLPAAQRLVYAIGLRYLTLFHLWRIPAAALFFAYGVQDLLPAGFWIPAGVGDLLAGLYAATALRGPQDSASYRRIHRFGLTDFVVAVSTGLAFTLAGDPRMALLTTLPMALVPLFGVGLSGASHLIALRLLR